MGDLTVSILCAPATDAGPHGAPGQSAPPPGPRAAPAQLGPSRVLLPARAAPLLHGPDAAVHYTTLCTGSQPTQLFVIRMIFQFV